MRARPSLPVDSPDEMKAVRPSSFAKKVCQESIFVSVTPQSIAFTWGIPDPSASLEIHYTEATAIATKNKAAPTHIQ